jgi:putative hydroxymethylpyrimidine transport system permease protein
MIRFLRPVGVFAGLCLAWEIAVRATGVPPYILPGPMRVATALVDQADFIALNAAITLAEMAAGMALGCTAGALCALALAQSRTARRWILPLVLASQAVPVFAIAPLLVLWFGFGMASKIVAAALVIFFPVASAFYDGLVRTERGWLDLAAVMGAAPSAVLFRLRVPAALPALASGIRVAAAVAPIGAVIGEWVGASAGLGFLMLQANARMRIDLLFAALAVLAFFAVAFYAAIDAGLRRLVPWQPVTTPND